MRVNIFVIVNKIKYKHTVSYTGVMAGLLEIILVILMASIRYVECLLHEPSLISIHPYEHDAHSDFGFAMGFQSEKSNLVVGAPSVDLIGKVYSCSTKNSTSLKEIFCQENHVNSSVFGKPSQNGHVRNQHMFLGSSIAATSEYFLTCAPLWSTGYCGNQSNPEAIGMCFIIDQHNSTPIVNSVYKRYCNIFSGPKGGAGWSIIADKDLGLLLIIKSALRSDITYASINNPTDTTSTAFRGGVKFKVQKFFNLGIGITSGKFFSNQTVFAFSMTNRNMGGAIEFIEYLPERKRLSVMQESLTKRTITFEAIGTMFGSALAAADLNLDGLDELLVAAPVLTIEEECVECGAVYIYLGGDRKTINQRNRLCIMGMKEFGRFGTALALKDIDGDNLPELVIGAPYEDEGLGAVYIISGYDIYRKLDQSVYLITPFELKNTQRIQKEKFRTLGYSLQFIDDVDGNGCSELVAGSPGSGAALLLKSIQVINVTVSSTLMGRKVVREQDTNYTIEVCATVEYPKRLDEICANLTSVSNVTDDTAYIPQPSFDLDISCTECPNNKTFCKNITVELKDKEPRVYKFETEVKLQTDNIFSSTEFNRSWVVTSPYSQMIKTIEVFRYCDGVDCLPQLSVEVYWSGSKKYILGSSALETVTVQVRNDGHSSYEGCVWVNVQGALLSVIGCEQIKSEYKCDVIRPLKRDTEYSIDLILNMEKPTNLDKELIVQARLYENCYKPDSTTQIKNITIPYVINADHVYVNGISHNRNMTDNELQDDVKEIFDDQEYLITNNGSITWKQAIVIISMKKKPFINTFKVSAEEIQCGESHTDSLFNLTCYFDLKGNTTRKLIATTGIVKSVMMKHLANNMLILTSQLELHLYPSDEIKTTEITSKITTKQQQKVASNKWLTALIASVIAILVLTVVIIVLWKCGFFKRKQKQRLHVLRESIKQRNSRRNTHISSAADENEDFKDVQIIPEDDSAFEDILPKNNHAHHVVEDKVQVHREN